MITTYTDAGLFLSRIQNLLEENEAANNLMLGIATRLRDQPGWLKSEPYMAIVEEDGRPVFAALLTLPYRTIVTAFAPVDDSMLESVVRDLVDRHWEVPGVIGPSETSPRFAQAWTRLTGQPARVSVNERVYELRQVIPPAPPVPGRMRLAEEGDIERTGKWIEAFRKEAVPQDPPMDGVEWAQARVSSQSLHVWEDDGKIVSMAMKARPVAHSITVSAVYTPPEYRRRGYAGALVAALSQSQLDAGYQFCTLFTDLSNPTSNSIYQKIGYRPVCDYQEYLFRDA